MASFIGIDTTNFFREGFKAFKAPLGVAVEVDDYDGFDDNYQKIVGQLIQDLSIDTNRKCVKSHYIYEKNPKTAVRFGVKFTEKIIPYLKNIHIAHTILNQLKTPEIMCCNGTMKLSTNQFVPILESYYNHIVAWKIIQDFPEKKESVFCLDHFTGSITKAWEEIENDNLFVLSAGEYCDPLISTADIIAKYISDFIHNTGTKLDYSSISSAFSNFNVTEVKHDMDATEIENALNTTTTKLYQRFIYDLRMITPSSRRSMNVDKKLKHPVIFVLTSKKLSKEKSAMETTPLFDIITNKAYAIHGCVKAINIDDLNSEIRYMKDGDEMVTVGDDAFDKAKYLIEDLSGFSIKITTSKELLKNK